MEYRWQKFGRRFHFSFEKVEAVTGVNSNLEDGSHFLMWDFDDIPLPIVIDSLENIQDMFELPAVHVVGTGKPSGFHAYCLKRCDFRLARTVLAATANVDTNFVALGMIRGYFTLRFTDVPGREFEPIGELPSKFPDDCTFKDAFCFVKYTKKVKA